MLLRKVPCEVYNHVNIGDTKRATKAVRLCKWKLQCTDWSVVTFVFLDGMVSLSRFCAGMLMHFRIFKYKLGLLFFLMTMFFRNFILKSNSYHADTHIKKLNEK